MCIFPPSLVANTQYLCYQTNFAFFPDTTTGNIFISFPFTQAAAAHSTHRSSSTIPNEYERVCINIREGRGNQNRSHRRWIGKCLSIVDQLDMARINIGFMQIQCAGTGHSYSVQCSVWPDVGRFLITFMQHLVGNSDRIDSESLYTFHSFRVPTIFVRSDGFVDLFSIISKSL